eukprot:TRINITY_DN17159_c0_g1_i3.p1 TRINITY_DN17159_c0_g1~~TRINITY_DN17159_c0_g1_i3.p1  ORF type:complete len:142 (+),score=14.52 TRINITY_DN17159_c0_g1_i3:156-581(+)
MLRSLVGSEMCIRDRYISLTLFYSSSEGCPYPGRVTCQFFLRRVSPLSSHLSLRELSTTPTHTLSPSPSFFCVSTGGKNLVAQTRYVRPHWYQSLRHLYHYCLIYSCLLYTSDAADEEDSVDLGGRRIIKKKKKRKEKMKR